MADFPQSGIPPLFISSFSRYMSVVELGAALVPTAALTWPAANQAFYYPLSLPWPYPVRRVFWANGSSVTTTNFDLGIYTADGTKIYSTGSTAASGVSVLQYVTPSPDFVLSPGRYYLAMACSTNTASRGGTGHGGLSPAVAALAGMLIQATALPLPATMTPATAGTTVIPVCGITRTASGF